MDHGDENRRFIKSVAPFFDLASRIFYLFGLLRYFIFYSPVSIPLFVYFCPAAFRVCVCGGLLACSRWVFRTIWNPSGDKYYPMQKHNVNLLFCINSFLEITCGGYSYQFIGMAREWKILIILDKTIFPEGDSHLKLSFIVAAGPFLIFSLKPLWYLRKWERRSWSIEAKLLFSQSTINL